MVTLTSSNASVASVPANVSVASGQTSANFAVTTGSVSSDTAITITAAFNNTYANAPIMVRAPLPAPTPVTVSISPANVSVLSGGNQQFISTVTGSTNMSVTWTASGGSINSLGYFTAPTVNANTAVTVYATSQADPTVVKAAQVNVVPFVAPPSGGDPYSGSGPISSWRAYQYLDTDGRYHQAIYISNATGSYPVIGYSYSSAGCADLGDTFNDYWEPIGNGLWWFINRPTLVYVRWVWYNNISEKTILQQTPCIDYSGAPKYN
jgi:hypothetical protein